MKHEVSRTLLLFQSSELRGKIQSSGTIGKGSNRSSATDTWMGYLISLTWYNGTADSYLAGFTGRLRWRRK